MKNNHVVVTGLGPVSSVGIGKDDFWNSLVAGKSGITKVDSFDTSGFRCHYGGEIKDFSAHKYIDRRRLPFLGRTSQLSIAACQLAIKDANLNLKEENLNKAGVFIGTTMGEKALEESIDIWIKEGSEKVNKNSILRSFVNSIAANIGIYFKITGPNYLLPTACSAGNYAIGYGFDMIRKGDIDIALVGGADAFSRVAFSGFHRLYAMASEKVQPFDKNRKGMMVGEGAGILVLESKKHALARKAHIYSEILGYGLSCDASHMTNPKAEGIQKAIRKAVKEADISINDVDYINAHGTGTPANDKSECKAIKEVFDGKTNKLAVSSSKSMLGHTMGAASALESIICCLAIENDIIPPTVNFETPDPECDIDCVPNTARKTTVNVAIKDGFAFGGNNACVVFKKH